MDPITVGSGAVVIFLGAVVGLFKLVFGELGKQRQEAAVAAKEQREASAIQAEAQRQAFESTMNNHVSQTARAMDNVAAKLARLTIVIEEVVHAGQSPD